jgi:hypothetical protein
VRPTDRAWGSSACFLRVRDETKHCELGATTGRQVERLGYGHTSSISCWISASNEAQEIRAVGLNVRGHTEQ